VDLGTRPAALANTAAMRRPDGDRHVVDQLIDERAVELSKHALWPLLKPLLLGLLHYGQAVRMCDRIAGLSGWETMSFLSDLLSLDVSVKGIERLPRHGAFILAPTHPTGMADGIAVFDALKAIRPDMAIFANRDALRAAPGLRDLIIPVEWRQAEKSHARSRDTLEGTARAFAAKRAVILFPAGRIAFWHEGSLTERPWQTSIVALARRYDVPVFPVHVGARNSGLFYLVSKYSTELRDITLFHEFLNKKGNRFTIGIGRPVSAAALAGDPSELTARLQRHAVTALAADIDAEFEAEPAE